MNDWRPIEKYREENSDRLAEEKPVEVYALTGTGQVYRGPAVRYAMQWSALEKRSFGRAPRRLWPTHFKYLSEP